MRAIDADAVPQEFWEYEFDGKWRGCTIKDLLDSQPTIKPEPYWIPVEQALPEIGEYVLCQTTSHYFKTTHCFNNYHVCQFVDKDKWIDKPHFDWDRDGFPHVKAWMPLPEPYKGVTT